jgi:hypothetical protein
MIKATGKGAEDFGSSNAPNSFPVGVSRMIGSVTTLACRGKLDSGAAELG